ncbi:hypothetical protein M409DRAFT_50160 [Zasmidium cellare ATCC 36951]|uniref:GRF-type domain-containing protein n=1 Tax=Zasmidium cellare ATCC 36951 TaxID=1080233 RepID=A0A6A6CZL4_ZASCE|nr:uncharacterized protein M409DRAFT_50160 [Zasmidium cellare ATCC 36951]KAF2172465.1 hypothetical protein M409DRAFT_50160 [Zasmidium cellare ATCC 36951]
MQRGGRHRGGSNNYRGRGRGRGAGSIQPLRGLFASNIWHCDCSPRLPAEHFKVKKEGRNQGRWFYTCQNRNKGPPGSGEKNKGGCDFFLWDEDARLREEGSVIGNGREREREGQEGWDAGRGGGKGLFSDAASSGKSRGGQVVVREDSDTDVSPSPTPTPVANVRKKRNARDASLDNDDEEEDFGLQPDEEQELAKLDTSSFETPQKVQKTGVYATPATTVRKTSRKLPWADEVVEPVSPPTSTRKTVVDYFTTPSKPPAKAVTFEEPPTSSNATITTSSSIIQTPADSTTTPAHPSSPSPSSRYKDALLDPADSSSSLTSEVLAELSALVPNIPREKLSTLRGILSKHDLKTQGVTKGRDISRLALKAKGAKIAELEARIASLEAEREVDRSLIAGLRWRRGVGRDEEEGDEDGESQL